MCIEKKPCYQWFKFVKLHYHFSGQMSTKKNNYNIFGILDFVLISTSVTENPGKSVNINHKVWDSKFQS
jgi:hypothetical protein